MDMIWSFILGKLGLPGIVVIVAAQVIQFIMGPERAALVAAIKRFYVLAINVPRRWKSEIARIRTEIAELRAAHFDDEAQVKEVSIGVKASIRVLCGVQEDVLNAAVDLIVVLIPFCVTIVTVLRGAKKGR